MNSIDEVAEWIDVFVREGACYGATPTLRECMDAGDEHAEMRVLDDTGVEHRASSPVYETAFLAALRALVSAGDIVPAAASEEQRSAWTRWMAGDPLAPGTRGPVLGVPLRATERRGPEEDSRTSAQRAGDHLLSLLRTEGRIQYSRFYDGSAATARRLRDICDCKSDVVSAELLMDMAAAQLEEQRYARLVTLPGKLADDENDYAIELTEEGKALLEAGRRPRFRDVIR